MIVNLDSITANDWFCQKCQVPLEALPVDISYLESNFQVALPRCPKCGFTFIPPELALGKMRDVEKILEDK